MLFVKVIADRLSSLEDYVEAGDWTVYVWGKTLYNQILLNLVSLCCAKPTDVHEETYINSFSSALG